MKKQILVILALVLSLSATAIAHPGRTDDRGGHYDHDTGQYHYHHGYEAHQHTGGICPFDFDDRTGESSGSSPSSSSATDPDWTPTFSAKEKKTSIFDTLVFIFMKLPVMILGSLYLGWCTYCLISFLVIDPIRDKAKAEKERLAREALDKNQRIEEQRRAKHQKIHDQYSRKTRTEIAKSCGMPDGFYIDENDFVHELNSEGTLDRCTVYVTSYGSVYHRHQHCGEHYLYPHNIVQVRHLNTCRYCAPDRFDLQWYDNYLEVLSLMRKHGIEPAPDPDAEAPR